MSASYIRTEKLEISALNAYHSTNERPISKLAHALGKAAEQRDPKRKADPDAKSSVQFLPVFSCKPVQDLRRIIVYSAGGERVFCV